MLNTIVTVMSLVLSISAFIITILNFLLAKRKLVSDSIARNRMDWIKEVRTLTQGFVESYLKGEGVLELRIQKSKIELYIRKSPAYDRFDSILEHCVNTPYNKEDYEKLIDEAQNVLNGVWRRMKLETGISKKEEGKIVKKIRNSSETDVMKSEVQ